jgi:formylglycine-generating enzyme required for sulfatase activity
MRCINLSLFIRLCGLCLVAAWTVAAGTQATAEPFSANTSQGPRFQLPTVAEGRPLRLVTQARTGTATKQQGITPSVETSAVPLRGAPPPMPTAVSATEGNGQVTVSWQPVAGAVSYNIYYATDLSVSKTTGIKVANVQSPAVIAGLTNKVDYFLVVTSLNEFGESSNSPSASATPLASKPVHALILIPAGPFQMGDNLGDIPHNPPRQFNYALPVHTVHLDTFYIDRYETTYDLWKEVYDWAIAKGYSFDRPGTSGSNGNGTNMPVTGVSWYDVVKWLNARSEKEKRVPVYYTDAARSAVYRTGRVDITNDWVNWKANGYRLPTEAEWEKAARGGLAGKRYPWGDELGVGNGNDKMGRTTSVGVYPPNGYELYDMAGNVFEWVWDWGSAGEGYKWASDPIANPRGPAAPPSGTQPTRIRRGGGFAYGSRYLSCFERMFRVPTYTAPYFGFRAASNQP